MVDLEEVLGNGDIVSSGEPSSLTSKHDCRIICFFDCADSPGPEIFSQDLILSLNWTEAEDFDLVTKIPSPKM